MDLCVCFARRISIFFSVENGSLYDLPPKKWDGVFANQTYNSKLFQRASLGKDLRDGLKQTLVFPSTQIPSQIILVPFRPLLLPEKIISTSMAFASVPLRML